MSTSTKKPNILFILIDDLGWKDLSSYGSTFYETPSIDRIAQNAVRFTSAYAASPICSPTRASIMTGKYPARLKTTQFFGSFRTRGKLISGERLHHLPLEERTIANVLKKKGYNTFHIGKWHLGKEPYTPENQGFDINIGGCHWGHPKHGYFSPYDNPKLSDGPKGEYLTDRLTDEALNLIEENKDRPFFMYLSYYSVHVPIQAPAHLIEKYKKKACDLGLDVQKTFEKGEKFPCEHKKHNHIIRRIIQSNPEYAAMIERLDWNIGRVLDKIEEMDLEEDTILIFFSDNGGLATAEGSPTCNYPLSEGKGWMYEGGTRVPLIIKWPHIVKEASECDIPVISTDFFPTILEMIGEKIDGDSKIDGKSFVPLLKGEEISPHPIYWHYPHYSNQGGTPTSSMRLNNFKLIKFYETDKYKLFDLEKDIHEKVNLCQKHPQKFSSLKKQLDQWIRKTEAELPEPNPIYGKRFRDISHKIIARAYWLFTRLSPLFKKIRKNISKFDK